VKALAQLGKAILLSSHILTELSEMCTSVTVIERGKILGSGTVADVVKSVTPRARIYLRALAGPEAAERALLERPHVAGVRREREGVSFDLEGGEEELAQLVAELVRAELRIVELSPQVIDLEDIFLSLTEGKLQ